MSEAFKIIRTRPEDVPVPEPSAAFQVRRSGAEPEEVVEAQPESPFSLGGGTRETGLRFPMTTTPGQVEPGPAELRVALETATSAIPGAMVPKIGLRIGTPLARRLGESLIARTGVEAAGATGGSLLAQTFDPTAEPAIDALMSGGLTAVVPVVTGPVAAAARKLVGRPTGRGKELLDFVEAQGAVPPVGAVLSDSAFVSALNSVARADAIMGKKIEEIMSASQGDVTQALRRVLADYIRYKRTANRAFKSWDNLRMSTIGDSRVVVLDPELMKAADAAASEFERVGATSALDNNLLGALAAAKEQIQQGAGTFRLSLSEAEALRSLLYAQANLLRNREAGMAVGKTIGGLSPSGGVRKHAEEVGGAIERSIDIAIKDGRMPKEATKVLAHAKEIWKDYKQGMAVVDELRTSLQTAAQMRDFIGSNEIKAAVERLYTLNEKAGRPVVDTMKIANLAKIGRLMETLEKAGSTSAFQYSVRAQQAMALTAVAAGVAGFPGISGAAAGIALTPTAISWLLGNEKAINFLLTGMRAKPGTATAMRAFRQLAILGAKEGILAPPDREGFVETPGGAAVGRGPQPTPTPATPPASPEVGVDAPFRFGRMRANMAPSDPFHAVVAPLEHREFVEEAVRENPLSAVPLTLAIPAYSALKGSGLLPSGENTSPATLDEVFAGFEGLARGLRRRAE